jgi:hypothetical protein
MLLNFRYRGNGEGNTYRGRGNDMSVMCQNHQDKYNERKKH